MNKSTNGTRFCEAACKYILYSVLKALKFMHDKGVSHRDVKPDNVLINLYCDVKLGDYGFSKFPMEANKYRTLLGTEGYIAPEILAIHCK